MPELPEVETVRDGLERHIVGKHITSAKVYRDYSVRRHVGGPADFEAQLAGQQIEYVARRGKFLWLGLADAGTALVGHLGMSGQLLLKTRGVDNPELPRHGRVRMWLSGDEPLVLDFVDQRTFGYLAVSDVLETVDGLPGGLGTTVAGVPRIVEHIARDLLDPYLADGTAQRAELNTRIRGKSSAIKKVLLDQAVVSGVGNIYADEALWRAEIHGERPASRLTRSQVASLLNHAHDVMTESLRQGGTSFDALYVNVNGESGYFSRALNAYGREGEPCLRCGTQMRRSSFMNRSSYWCPRCQPKPRSTR